jgi:hypothetical protein
MDYARAPGGEWVSFEYLPDATANALRHRVEAEPYLPDEALRQRGAEVGERGPVESAMQRQAREEAEAIASWERWGKILRSEV